MFEWHGNGGGGAMAQIFMTSMANYGKRISGLAQDALVASPAVIDEVQNILSQAVASAVLTSLPQDLDVLIGGRSTCQAYPCVPSKAIHQKSVPHLT